jgi:hypothetical protein
MAFLYAYMAGIGIMFTYVVYCGTTKTWFSNTTFHLESSDTVLKASRFRQFRLSELVIITSTPLCDVG